MADIMAYAITGILTAFIIAVPMYAIGLLVEHIYNTNPKFKEFIDKIA